MTAEYDQILYYQCPKGINQKKDTEIKYSFIDIILL